jgi:hypothetical protein
MDCGEEISGGFIVASGDGAVLLELAEEILDEVACRVSDMAGRDKALKSQRRRVIPYKYCLIDALSRRTDRFKQSAKDPPEAPPGGAVS